MIGGSRGCDVLLFVSASISTAGGRRVRLQIPWLTCTPALFFFFFCCSRKRRASVFLPPLLKQAINLHSSKTFYSHFNINYLICQTVNEGFSAQQIHRFTLILFPSLAFIYEKTSPNMLQKPRCYDGNVFQQYLSSFPPGASRRGCACFSVRARPPSTSSILHRQTQNQPPISLNSLNRQALTGIDRCSDGGM